MRRRLRDGIRFGHRDVRENGRWRRTAFHRTNRGVRIIRVSIRHIALPAAEAFVQSGRSPHYKTNESLH
jgi:hypothetical protein